MSHLVIQQLRKQYDQTLVVDDLNLTVEQGEFISLLGPSGCGKTTTLRMIAGLLNPTSGSIRLNGEELTTVPTYKRNIGLVFQNYALFPHLTIFENVAFGLKRRGVAKGEMEARVTEALASVQLSGFEQRYPTQLSGGQQQRVALARVLVLRPPLVLFDEPLSNLDAKLRQFLRVEIRQLQKKIGFTAIFVTHDQEEAMVLSDRIAVMYGGKITQLGQPKDIYRNPVNSFVADFIGEANMLAVTEVSKVGEEYQGKLISGGEPISANQGAGDAHDGVMMVRPEDITLLTSLDALSAAERKEHNYVQGTVEYIHFIGTEYIIGLAVEGQEKIFLSRSKPEELQRVELREHDLVYATWSKQATILL